MMRYLPWIALSAALASVPFLSTYHASLAVYAVVLALFCTSVNIVVGYLGLISFGHAAFLGLGAYTAGLLTVKLGVNYWLAVVLGMLPGAALGALVGFASLRLSGAYFAIATLVVSEILRIVAMNWIDLTRGALGLLVPKPGVGPFGFEGLRFTHSHLIIAILALATVLFLVSRLVASPYGRAWLLLRDQPKLAASVGISGLRYKTLAVAVSGAIAALAGGMLVPKILVLTPDLFSSTLSATGLLGAILGGRATIAGPVLGGAIFAVAPELLRFVEEYRIAVFALLLLAVVRIRPEGLMSLLPRRRRHARHARTQPNDVEIAPRTALADIRVDRLTKSFGGLAAVRDVTFPIPRGQVLGIIGPNGAGKTTCLNLISAFLTPSSGQVTMGERVISDSQPHETARHGIVRTFQHTTLSAGKTVLENVVAATHLLERETLPGALWRGAGFRRREADRLALGWACLDYVGLGERADMEAGSLAYGEQRMLSIAITLATKPHFLLLDEPAAGLNHSEAMAFAALIENLREKGFTVVIVDHNLRMMLRICDRLVVMHHGELLADGDPMEVRNNPEVISAYLGGGPRKQKEAADVEMH
ncbi:MAG: branched-chain amino acid ABC transporter ATP-binding protein/permease [Nitratireductor sp.]|nr:branched-chain amino acid ABC transporter ATP-binding protein/permease [Nitratireductor sp.]